MYIGNAKGVKDFNRYLMRMNDKFYDSIEDYQHYYRIDTFGNAMILMTEKCKVINVIDDKGRMEQTLIEERS